MSAWSRQYQLCRELGEAEANKHKDVERPRVTFHHPIFEVERKQNDEHTIIPNEWTMLLPSESAENPFVENNANIANEATNDVSCTVYYRSRDQIEVMKKKSLEETNQLRQQQPDGKLGIRVLPYLSSNDALLGEVRKQLETNYDFAWTGDRY